jgi:hypothetical protein
MTESARFTDFVGRALKKDRLTLSERGGEVVGILCIALFVWFFRENQIQNTGFFTSKFGPMESFLFYGSMLFGVVTGSARALIGRRNVVRPLEVVGALLWASASYWFLQVFPFDFSHLPDLLPDAIKFLLGWLTNDVAMLLLIIGVVCGVVQAVYTTWLFLTVLRRRQANGK